MTNIALWLHALFVVALLLWMLWPSSSIQQDIPMTANDDGIFKGLIDGRESLGTPTDYSPYSSGSGSLGTRPYFGIDPSLPGVDRTYIRNNNQWEPSLSHTAGNALTNDAYRASFKGKLETLTQIVSDNADYLVDQIQVETGPKDTHVYIPIGKTHGVPPKFTFPGGEINHSIAKKYMDWLAMVQLILQDG